MAEEVAKSPFTKRANYLSGMAESITEPELWQEFKALIGARKVTEPNDDLCSGLFVDVEAANLDKGEEDELNAQQEADLKKMATECVKRVNEDKLSLSKMQKWPVPLLTTHPYLH